MWGKFKQHLIDDARLWYKRWSSWLAIAWGGIVAVFWTSPSWMGSIVAAVPPDVRMASSPVIWIAMASLPIVITQLKQKKLGK